MPTDDGYTLVAMEVGGEHHREALLRQLAMNQQTWQALEANGVTQSTDLRLDFFYVAPGEGRAQELLELIQRETDYDVRISSNGRGLLRKKEWAVTGTTKTTQLSPAVLDEWVTWMVTAGFQTGCEFDGWGAEVPTS